MQARRWCRFQRRATDRWRWDYRKREWLWRREGSARAPAWLASVAQRSERVWLARLRSAEQRKSFAQPELRAWLAEPPVPERVDSSAPRCCFARARLRGQQVR